MGSSIGFPSPGQTDGLRYLPADWFLLSLQHATLLGQCTVYHVIKLKKE